VSWSTGASFFHPDYGLKAGKLADAVTAAGPVLVDAAGTFWVYRGGVWRPDDKEIRRRVVLLLGERYRPAHLRAVLEMLAGTCAEFEVAPVPELINLRNGLLRWKGHPDPVLIEHHDACLSSVQLPIEWDPGAACPEFDAFLDSVLPEDDRNRAWQLLGYLMMSGNPLQRLFLLTGGGGNGKGVFLNVVRALLGADNFSAIPLRRFAETQFATAELHGKLGNVCGDIDAKFIEDTGRIKELAGDDDIDAERKGRDPFKFRFWGKAIFSANAMIGSSDSSKGWLRRWEVVNFPYEPTKPDPNLSARCTTPEELAGIAVKAVSALCELMREGQFARGESADTAHAELAEKANRVIRMINDPDSVAYRDPECWNKGTILVQAFREWEAHDSGDPNRHTGVQTINELLRQAGMRYAIKRGQRGYYGLRITGTVFIKDRDKPHLNVTRGDAPESAPDTQPDDDQLALELGI
jgi:P4 family phage/plasmid primase-like protien